MVWDCDVDVNEDDWECWVDYMLVFDLFVDGGVGDEFLVVILWNMFSFCVVKMVSEKFDIKKKVVFIDLVES